MRFYDALQMDPAILKRKIAACDTRQEKMYYWTAIAVRSFLIVAFAIVFISLLSGVFGADNTPMAVALFCMMLGIRFVNFEYCIGDLLMTLAVVLAILVLAPSAAAVLPQVFLIQLHFAAFFAVLYMTTQRPEMGNGGLYLFNRQSRGRRGLGSPWAFGFGGLFDLWSNPVCQASGSAQSNPFSQSGSESQVI